MAYGAFKRWFESAECSEMTELTCTFEPEFLLEAEGTYVGYIDASSAFILDENWCEEVMQSTPEKVARSVRMHKGKRN